MSTYATSRPGGGISSLESCAFSPLKRQDYRNVIDIQDYSNFADIPKKTEEIIRSLKEIFSLTAKHTGKVPEKKHHLQLLVTERFFFEHLIKLIQPLAKSFDLRREEKGTAYFYFLAPLEKQFASSSLPEDLPLDLFLLASKISHCCSCLDFSSFNPEQILASISKFAMQERNFLILNST